MEDDRYTRITLRIPKDLHEKLQAAADATSKSMNAEIIARLQVTFLMKNIIDAPPADHATIHVAPPAGSGVAGRAAQPDENAIADRIAKEVSDRLSMDIDARMSKLYDDMMRHLIHGTPMLEEPHFPKPGRPDIPHAKAHKTPKK